MGNVSEVRTAIHKLINYKKTTFDSLQKLVRYACNENASPAGLQSVKFISSVEDAVSDISTFEDRFHKKHGRLYKHWIYVPGLRVDAIDPQKLLAFGQKVLNDCFGDYPNVIAVHINVPRRIHMHAVIGCTSVKNGKKLEQSPSDFNKFRFTVDNFAKEYGFPLLRKRRGEIKLDESNRAGVIEGAYNPSYYGPVYGSCNLESPSLFVPSVYPDHTGKIVAEDKNTLVDYQILQQQVVLAQLALANNIANSINNVFLQGLEDGKNGK